MKSFIIKCHLLLTCLIYVVNVEAQSTWKYGVRGNDYGPANSSSHDDDVIDIAADPNGNVYVLTRVYAQGDVNGVTVKGYVNALNTIESIVVSSYDCNGAYRWHKVIGGTAGHNKGVAIKTDTLGGVYITGSVLAYQFHPDTQLYPDSLHIDKDFKSASTNKTFFVVKYDTSGAYRWLKMPEPDTISYVTSFSNRSLDMDVAPDGEIFLYSMLGPGAYDSGAFSIGTKHFYVLCYDKNGAFKNVTPLDISYTGSDKYSNPSNAHFKRDHASGRFYLSGIFEGYYGTMAIGSTQLNYSGGYSQKLYVGCFDKSGGASWARQATAKGTGTFGSATMTRCRVALDDSGNVFVTGFAYTGDSWYGHVFSNPLNSTVIFLLKLDKAGNTQWVTTPAVEAGEALQVGYSNGIIGVAGLYGNMVWGGFKIALKLGDLRDVFLARFSSSTGTVIGLDTLKSMAGGEEWVTAMTADKNGSFSVGGFYTDLLYVSGKTLTPVYDQDWFLAKFGPKGCTCATPTSDYTYSINGLGKVDFVYNGTILIDSVVWDFGDGSKASGRRINKTYNTAGTYTVCASVYNSCGMSTHCENINITGVSVQHAKHLSSISVYPNPTSGELKVRGAKGTTMDIYNMVGKHVLHMSLISSDATLDVTHLSAGTYMIRFTDNQQRTILRFDKL